MKIGIPRALLYYDHYPLWSTLLEALGHEVVLSPPTNKAILNRGVSLALDEACLPVKICYGHLAAVEDRVAALFLPRTISQGPGMYLCPKLMGLPDMVEPTLGAKLLSPVVDLRRGERQLFRELAGVLGAKFGEVRRAFAQAQRSQEVFRRAMQEQKLTPQEALAGGSCSFGEGRLKIGLLGHPYLLYDSFLNMDLFAFLRERQIFPLTPQMFSPQRLQAALAQLPKKLFWLQEGEIMGAGLVYLEEKVDGIIHLSSFGCGPDAMIGELMALRAQGCGVPLLELNLDEQTGQGGIETRLEAFLDMLKRRCPA
jgi:predicted nucleotide-binding protein (sugar kinase/HSP70/actin superfamily)